MTKRRILGVATLLLMFLLLLSACNKKEQVSEQEIDEPEDEIEENVDEEKTAFHYPLTGLPALEEPTDRAISVMINNHPAARQQSGLYKADLVYEVLAEGGVTRFLAVFQSEKPEVVGPVRSARDYYIELAKGLDSFYVFHGFSPSAQAMIESGYIDSLNGLYHDGSLFKRASFRKAPHNSYITYENILKGIEKVGASMTGAPKPYQFLKEDENITGAKADNISISYSNKSFEVRYEYDEESNSYKRFSGDVQTVDYDTEEPVLLQNILVVEMKHTVIDNEGRRDIDLTSGGNGLLFEKGIVRKIEWKNIDGRIVPFLNGEEAQFTPGKIWINIVPKLDIVKY